MPQNKKSNCAASLRARILSLNIAPGATLEELTLCAEYGISRTPLREVLHRLAGDGYVKLEDNRGAKVASMDLAVMRVFFQTAPLVYSSIARLAAENRTLQQVAGLNAVQADFVDAAQAANTSSAALLNHRFHEIIGEMAQNPYLAVSLNRMLIDHTRLSQTFFRPTTAADDQRIAMAIEQHDRMIAAIEAQDAARAVALTLQHWDLSRDQMEKYVRPDPLPLEPMMDYRHAV